MNAYSQYVDGPKIALWAGLAVGLGLVIHEIFFAFAAAIALRGLFEWFIHCLWAEEKHSAGAAHHA
jgi:hypothetical protein